MSTDSPHLPHVPDEPDDFKYDDDRSLRDMVGEISFRLREIHSELQAQNKAVSHLMNWKTGGERPENGMDVRMDRIERSSKNVAKIAWAAASGLFGIIGTWVWHQITGKQSS